MQRSVKFNRIATSVDYGRWPNARGVVKSPRALPWATLKQAFGQREIRHRTNGRRCSTKSEHWLTMAVGQMPVVVVKKPRALPWATLKQAFGHKDIGWRRLTTWYATRIRHDYAFGVKHHCPGLAGTSRARACATLGKRAKRSDEREAVSLKRSPRVTTTFAPNALIGVHHLHTDC